MILFAENSFLPVSFSIPTEARYRKMRPIGNQYCRLTLLGRAEYPVVRVLPQIVLQARQDSKGSGCEQERRIQRDQHPDEHRRFEGAMARDVSGLGASDRCHACRPIREAS